MYITKEHCVSHVHHCATLYNLMQRKITCVIVVLVMYNMCTYVTFYCYVENNEHYILHHVTLCSLTCTWQNYIEQHVHIRCQCVLTCGYVGFLSNNIVQHVTIMYTLLQDYYNNTHDMATCTNMCTSIANMSWHCYNKCTTCAKLCIKCAYRYIIV